MVTTKKVAIEYTEKDMRRELKHFTKTTTTKETVNPGNEEQKSIRHTERK